MKTILVYLIGLNDAKVHVSTDNIKAFWIEDYAKDNFMVNVEFKSRVLDATTGFAANVYSEQQMYEIFGEPLNAHRD